MFSLVLYVYPFAQSTVVATKRAHVSIGHELRGAMSDRDFIFFIKLNGQINIEMVRIYYHHSVGVGCVGLDAYNVFNV